MISRCTAFSYLEGDPELAYFAIYDGHGGTGVANYLKDHLHEFILDQPEYQEGNMEEAIVKAFLQVTFSHCSTQFKTCLLYIISSLVQPYACAHSSKGNS